MKPLSPKVVGTAADIALGAFNEPGLDILFMKSGLDHFQSGSRWSKGTILTTTVRAALDAVRDGDTDAADGLREFVRLVAEKTAPRQPPTPLEPNRAIRELREVLRADGFDLAVEYEDVEDRNLGPRTVLRGVRLLPLEDPRVPLSDAITALEHDFQRLSMPVALNHYRQAVTLLVDEQHYEAANSCVRSMFEEVICELAASRGRPRAKQGDGGDAIAWLKKEDLLPDRDGGRYIAGLWQMTHTNGPHPGTTTAGEARFRLLALTAAARFLIDKLAPA
jgi:hypothetical protein